jgi:phage terminase small subunit
LPFLSVTDGRIVPGNGKGRKLTPKMVEFVDLYMIHQNATKAVELSSYKTINPARHAADLMQHPLIQKEIKQRLAVRSEKAEVKAEYLINKLMNIIEQTQSDNPQACLRAIELAGKSIALWKERQEISGPDGEAIRHEQHVKESVADFTSRVASLAKRNGTSNVVEFAKRPGEGGA